MKAIQNIEKSVVQVLKQAYKTTTSFYNIQDTININCKKEEQLLTYKPSLLHCFNHIENLKTNSLYDTIKYHYSKKIDKMEKYADPTRDVAFKKIFNENNIEGLKDFVGNIISTAKDFPFSTTIKEMEFLNKDHMPAGYKGKKSLCDLKIKDDKGNIYIVEMQKKNELSYLNRIQYYSSHAIINQIQEGTDHGEIKPVITISLIGSKCFKNDNIPCVSFHRFAESVTNEQTLKDQSHIFIELAKLKNAQLSDTTKEWLYMFKEASKQDHIPDNVKNIHVKEAYMMLEKHNWTLQDREAYDREKVEEDIIIDNLRKTEEKGFKEGLKKVVENMLLKNKPIKEIIEFTELTEKEIQDIKDKK